MTLLYYILLDSLVWEVHGNPLSEERWLRNNNLSLETTVKEIIEGTCKRISKEKAELLSVDVMMN